MCTMEEVHEDFPCKKEKVEDFVFKLEEALAHVGSATPLIESSADTTAVDDPGHILLLSFPVCGKLSPN